MKKLDEYINEGMFNTAPEDILNIDDEAQRYWDMLATVISFPRAGSNDDRINFYTDFNLLFKQALKKGRDIGTFDPKKDLLIGVEDCDWAESKPSYQIMLFKKGETDNYLTFGTWQKRKYWKIETNHNVHTLREGDLERYTDKTKWTLNRVFFPIDIKSLGWKWEKLWKNGLQNIRY